MFSDLDWVSLIAWFTLTFGIGNSVSNTMVSGQYSNALRDMGIYPISPPSIIFSAIWIPIYICNSVAVFLIWQTKAENSDVAIWELSLAFYVVQNFLASFWSSLIFNYRNIKLSMAIIVFAFIFTTCNVLFFYMQHKVAAVLLTLYWFWMLGLAYFTIGIAMTKKAPPMTEAFLRRNTGTPQASQTGGDPDRNVVGNGTRSTDALINPNGNAVV